MNYAGLGAYIFSGYPNARGWISLEILQPVRGRIFGDEIEASIVLREPDLISRGRPLLRPPVVR